MIFNGRAWIVSIRMLVEVTSKYMDGTDSNILSSSYQNDLSHERGHDVGLGIHVIGEEFSCQETFLFLVVQPCC